MKQFTLKVLLPDRRHVFRYAKCARQIFMERKRIGQPGAYRFRNKEVEARWIS